VSILGTDPFYESLLESVGKLVQHGYISPQEVMSQPGGLAPFGLEPPRMTITILEGTNRHSLLVGKPTPVRDQVYVKLLGSAGIAITDASFLRKQGSNRSLDLVRPDLLFRVAPAVQFHGGTFPGSQMQPMGNPPHRQRGLPPQPRMFSRRSPRLMRWWIAPANSTRSRRGIAPESQADQKGQNYGLTPAFDPCFRRSWSFLKIW
jgi:hypothetical protein